MKRKRGVSILAIIVATVIVATGVMMFAYSLRSARKQAVRTQEYLIAQGYASEILELFRGHTQDQLKSYLSDNPFTPQSGANTVCPTCTNACDGCPACTQPSCTSCAQCTPYQLCAHVNLLDRTSMSGANYIGKLLNEDPVAKLPANSLDGSSPQSKTNRWYQVQVVDITTLVRNPAACDNTAQNLTLGANERFLVTVGMSWIPKNKQNPDVEKDAERIVVTSVIP